uniref:Tetraspanin n=1 Tax=Lepeophtheirus salmonis TaxID=72036 RepID=C1BV70_LEPSM|nr:CD63 antigen [Lepeophtheirus salmonis]
MATGRKYTALIWFLDVFLLLISTALIYLGTSLIVFYNIDRLDFETSWYSAVPYFMICTGIANFLTALYGFAASSAEKRMHLISYAVILLILFVVQIVAIFAALELRSDINNDTVENTDMFDAMVNYERDEVVKERWDTLHRQYHCCGGINYNVGYMIWTNVPLQYTNSVPDSCCLHVAKGCGRNILLNHEVASEKIFVHGCYTMMADKLDNEVVPLCLGYTGVGTIIALIQIIIAVLALSRSASIKRKHKYADSSKSIHGSYDGLHLSPSTPRSERTRLNPVSIPQPTFISTKSSDATVL